MNRNIALVVALVLFTGSPQAQTIDSVTDEFDYCPELKRSVANPEGLRECNAGCIEEKEFSFARGIAAIEKLADELRNPSEHGWEREIGIHANLTVSTGAILRLRLLFAHQNLSLPENRKTAIDRYEAQRQQYCEFLMHANYLD